MLRLRDRKLARWDQCKKNENEYKFYFLTPTVKELRKLDKEREQIRNQIKYRRQNG